MQITREVLRFDHVDSQGDLFLPTAFSRSEGKQVPMNFDFDGRRFAGEATVRSTETALLCDFDSEILDRVDAPADPRIAAGFMSINSQMIEGHRVFIEADLTHLGIVKAEDIIK